MELDVESAVEEASSRALSLGAHMRYVSLRIRFKVAWVTLNIWRPPEGGRIEASWEQRSSWTSLVRRMAPLRGEEDVPWATRALVRECFSALAEKGGGLPLAVEEVCFVPGAPDGAQAYKCHLSSGPINPLEIWMGWVWEDGAAG